MAIIHGISGSTQYLINGTRPINGKKVVTLDEIHHLYDHYEDVLTETERTISRQQDEIILGLTNDESKLNRQLQEAISKRTAEVDQNITELNEKSNTAGNVISKIGLRMQYWIAITLRNRQIQRPFSDISGELSDVQGRKRRHIENKLEIVQAECNTVTCSYNFLKSNETFLIGADGEELVISVLSQLSDDYHVINDVNLHFDRAIHWRERNEYIKHCQIDHIVVGPTGIFMLETKNWKPSDIELKSNELKRQVDRSSLALWYYLKNYYGNEKGPSVRKVIVSIHGSSPERKFDKYIDVVAPNQLCWYITGRKSMLSEDEITTFVSRIPQAPMGY